MTFWKPDTDKQADLEAELIRIRLRRIRERTAVGCARAAAVRYRATTSSCR